MQNARVLWQNPPTSTTASCPLCQNTQANQIVLQALHYVAERGYLDLARCGACASAWFPEAASKNAAYPPIEQVLQDPNFIYLIHHYLEIVNGLDWKVPMLERLPFEQFNSVLEIGCNTGVALDYCRTIWPANEVIGLEPSAYGVVGSKVLDIPILASYLENAASLQNKQFDFIYATEVLEHIEEPVKFLQALRAHLTEKGVVLLTTPRAEVVHEQTPLGELYAALSTGSHYFLLSAKQLKQLANQAGFQYCQLEPFGMTQIAVLSNQHIKLKPYASKAERIYDYYQQKAQADTLYARTHLGYLIHYHNQAVDCARSIEPALHGEIEQLLKQYFDLDLKAPNDFIQQLLATDHLVSFGKLAPYSLPFYLVARLQNQVQLGTVELQQLILAKIIILQGLKTDFQNLFVYHALLLKIDSILNTQLAKYPNHAELSDLERLSNQLRAMITELNQTVPAVAELKTLLKEHAKTKFFRKVHKSLTKIKRQLA